jgi:hypothetical protein
VGPDRLGAGDTLIGAILNSTPSFSATVCASVIMAAASSRVSGWWQMSSRVAWVSALIGLKLRLPHNLTQISERMSRATGLLKPAAITNCQSASMRSLRAPSSSPSVKQLPSMSRTTPGSINSVAGYTTEPMTRSTSMLAATIP